MLTTYVYIFVATLMLSQAVLPVRTRRVNYLAKSTADMYVHIKVSQALDVYLSQNVVCRTHT